MLNAVHEICIYDLQNRLYPGLVHDTKLMIKELENVTVLWEELWLGTLQDLHAGDFFFLSHCSELILSRIYLTSWMQIMCHTACLCSR